LDLRTPPNWYRTAIFWAAVFVLILRTPAILIWGSPYAEEGSVYLRYAWDAPALPALLAPHQGYYSLLPNLCGLLGARVLPLAAAGLLFAWTALAVYCLLVYLVLQCEALGTTFIRASAVIVCLFTFPANTLWLSTIHSQFVLAVATAVILLSDARRHRTLRLCTIAVAGLAGVTSCILLPFFVWSAWSEKSRERMTQALLLVFCTVIQAAVVLHMAHTQFRGFRAASSPQFLLGAFLTNSPMSVLLTPWSGYVLCRVMFSPNFQRFLDPMWLGTEVLSLVWMGLIAWLLLRGGRASRKLGAMAIISVVVGLTGSLSKNFDLMCLYGQRYFYIFNSLIALGFVFAMTKPATSRRLASFLLCCCVVSGMVGTLQVWSGFQSAPRWSVEARAWERDHTTPLAVGPEGWPPISLIPNPNRYRIPVGVYDSNAIPARK
jgi:hypothetical protein